MANKDMLINYVGGEECRIAIVEDGRLEELYAERASSDTHVGNIYRGKVTRVLPGMQAAFVDLGPTVERAAFLYVADVLAEGKSFDLDDADGLAREAAASSALGFTGKAAIHPKQIAPINDAFSPSA